MSSIVIIRVRQSYKYYPPGATQDEYEKDEQGRTLTLGALLHPGIFADRENRRILLLVPWLSLSASRAVLLSIASGVRSSCTLCVADEARRVWKVYVPCEITFAKDQY